MTALIATQHVAHWCTLPLEGADPVKAEVRSLSEVRRDGQARLPVPGPHETRRAVGAGRIAAGDHPGLDESRGGQAAHAGRGQFGEEGGRPPARL
ncbi:MAG TPA: hypothetical protein VD995_00825 [Azospirillum sp.]|nr:hypothetical protein [Azospirillum sp.]